MEVKIGNIRHRRIFYRVVPCWGSTSTYKLRGKNRWLTSEFSPKGSRSVNWFFWIGDKTNDMNLHLLQDPIHKCPFQVEQLEGRILRPLRWVRYEVGPSRINPDWPVGRTPIPLNFWVEVGTPSLSVGGLSSCVLLPGLNRFLGCPPGLDRLIRDFRFLGPGSKMRMDENGSTTHWNRHRDDSKCVPPRLRT